MSVLCNYCKEPVVYIMSRGETVKCDPEKHVGYQSSGRKVEVHLLHECSGNNNRKRGEFFEKKDDKKGLRLSDSVSPGREDNQSDGG